MRSLEQNGSYQNVHVKSGYVKSVRKMAFFFNFFVATQPQYEMGSGIPVLVMAVPEAQSFMLRDWSCVRGDATLI